MTNEKNDYQRLIIGGFTLGLMAAKNRLIRYMIDNKVYNLTDDDIDEILSVDGEKLYHEIQVQKNDQD